LAHPASPRDVVLPGRALGLGWGASLASRRVWLLAILLVFFCHLLWHAHGILSARFQNLDVAGIVYNARLLLAGRLPYVDSVEIKPPGAFLIFAPWLALGGLRAVWLFSVVWAAATSIACGWLGASFWGDKWGPRIAVLHAGGAALAADGDINYSFWMTLPFVLSAALAVRALHAPRRRAYAGMWLGAGALAAVAVLVRPSAVVLGVFFAVLAAIELRRHTWRRVGLLAAAAVVGALLATALVAWPLLRHGSIRAMIDGYLSVRQYASESIAAIITGAGGRLPATINGIKCLPDQLPAYHLFLAAALVPVRWRRGTGAMACGSLLAWVFGVVCLSSITLTLRFFTHDNAPLWCGLSILALRPSGLIGVLLGWLSERWWLDTCVAAGLGILATVTGWQRLRWLQESMHHSDDRVAAICRRVAGHLSEADTVLAWGWTAWGVYEHCGRWAPGPVYKDLTTVTTPNTNTCNRGYDPPRFKNGPLADRYLDDLRHKRPALIVMSDYYKSFGAEPLDEWHEARLFIREHYVVLDVVEGFRALLRRDLAPAFGLPARVESAFAVHAEPSGSSACGATDDAWESR
jgi:hypothetical protein